ncbi:MAG: iron-containing alcohol dehydrogenase [Eubacteriales bacterium]|nr:iron-containing alcohol dehydrogenase [Eubacteriales bacterium]
MKFRYYLPTEILFGAGVLSTLHEKTLPGTHALVVTTSGKSVRRLGYLDRLLEQLAAAGAKATLYDKVSPNPTRDNVMEGAAMAREAGCDFLVALGGGSAIDAAKGMAVMAVNDGDCWDYVRDGSGKGLPLQARPLPIVAIPTTAGTGSEADAGCVISYPERKEKVSFGTPWSFPALSVVDPELMTSVPPMLTAYQGFDVLFHAVECYLSKAANPPSDLYGLDAIKRVMRSLPAAVRDGADMDARTDMAWASTEAGFCLTLSGLTAQHSLEHAMSGCYPELPHGAGLILISRAYLTRCAKQPEYRQRMLDLSRAMGAESAAGPEALLERLEWLMEECGVANLKMSQFGISRDALPGIARMSIDRRFTNERVPLSQEEALEILEQSYS